MSFLWYNLFMKVLLTTLNAKYIHKNLALRWLYVASPIQQDCVLKEYTIKDDLNKVANDILLGNYDVICFSCYIWNIEPTRKLIQMIKEKHDCRILVGGPEVSFESEYLLDEGVDAICLGEGEKANWEYILYGEAEGILTKSTSQRKWVVSDLKENESYENPYFLEMDKKDMKNRYLYLETSRGCPYNCAYCLSSTEHHVRFFSEEYVMNLLKMIQKSDVSQVKLLDRTFNCMPERALKIARYMNDECKNQVFQFEVVAETLSDELLDFFIYEADKKRFRFEVGVQSFNEKTLREVGRIQNNIRLKEVMKKMIDAGCILHTDLIAGLPYEDLNSFRHSFNELFSFHSAELQCGILKCLKGTSLRMKSKQYGFVYDEKPPYTILKTNWLSEEDMIVIENAAYGCEKFYNSSKLRRSIDLFIKLGYVSSAFDLLSECGKRLKEKGLQYHDDDLVMCLKACLKDELIVDAILMSDYMRLHKQKPKNLPLRKVSKEMKKECMEHLIEEGMCTRHEAYHYGVVEYAYEDGLCIQLVLYNAKHTYPRILIVKEKKVYEKIVENKKK